MTQKGGWRVNCEIVAAECYADPHQEGCFSFSVDLQWILVGHWEPESNRKQERISIRMEHLLIVFQML
jgi:hypothetical protein